MVKDCVGEEEDMYGIVGDLYRSARGRKDEGGSVGMAVQMCCLFDVLTSP